MSLILFVLYIFHLLSSGDGKYVFNHIINTTYVTELELYNIMKSSAYFTQYLNEVKAENIQFVPAIHDEFRTAQSSKHLDPVTRCLLAFQSKMVSTTSS